MMTSKQITQLQGALTLAYRDYEKKLNSHAFFKIHDRKTSEDLVQETFMKTWRYLVRGGNIDIMKAFLYHVLNNLIIDSYRKNKAVSLDVLLESGFEPSVDNSKRLFNILDGKAATLLIDRLPKVYRKIMRMRYVQDLSPKEISDLTGKSANSVSVQLHRGMTKLKQLYGSA